MLNKRRVKGISCSRVRHKTRFKFVRGAVFAGPLKINVAQVLFATVLGRKSILFTGFRRVMHVAKD